MIADSGSLSFTILMTSGFVRGACGVWACKKAVSRLIVAINTRSAGNVVLLFTHPPLAIATQSGEKSNPVRERNLNTVQVTLWSKELGLKW
jgi:hypothetical protein